MLPVHSPGTYAAVYTRSGPADSSNARVRLRVQKDRLLQEVALLPEEMRRVRSHPKTLCDLLWQNLPIPGRAVRPIPHVDYATLGRLQATESGLGSRWHFDVRNCRAAAFLQWFDLVERQQKSDSDC